MPLRFIRSVKGSCLLFADGFLYEKDKETDKTYWKCIKYKSYSCAGRVHTKNGEIIFDNNGHNHLDDSAEAEVKKIRLEVKKRAISNTTENSGTIVANILAGVPDTVAVRLPSVDCLKRLACRARSRVYPRHLKMDDSDVRCPICSRIFPRETIEDHANKCLFLNEPSEIMSSPAQKRSRIELDQSDSKSTLKKGKIETNKKDTIGIMLTSPLTRTVLNTTTSVNVQVQGRNEHVPLAERMRPINFETYVGQSHIIQPGTMLNTVLKKGEIPNLILWGPPGCGKTSLANVIANMCKQNPTKRIRFVKLSAAVVGVSDIKEYIQVASNELKFGRQTVIFMDEIHRFNKMQQDIFLPHVEAGTITLIGATTENPSFSLNSALLSRCRVVVLEKLNILSLITILKNAVEVLEGCVINADETNTFLFNKTADDTKIAKFLMDERTINWLAETCDGDARIALGGLELAVKSNGKKSIITLVDVQDGLKKSHLLYDRAGEQHYDMISALHKSVRASDDNAAIYWLARMIAGGEDPMYIARRLVRMASEDIGLADPTALGLAVNTMHACKMIGMPESDVILAQCVTYLARAPKSRMMEDALRGAQKLIAEHKGPQPGVPLHLRNAPTKLMKNLGYAKGYNMLHKDISGLTYLPEGLEHVNFFL